MRPPRFAWVVCVLGCSWGTISPDDFKKQFGISPNAGGKPEINVFSASGMSQCLTKLRAAVGENDVHATELTLHLTYMSLTARSPVHPDNVDSYECRNGEVGPSTPVKLGSSIKTLNQDTFTFSSIDFDGLPNRIDRAVTDLAIEGGTLSSVDISMRALSGNRRYVSVSVHVTGTRKDGRVEFDGKGNKIVHDDVAAVPPSSGTDELTRAKLAAASATLPLDTWVMLEAPEIVALQSFDPLTKLVDWAPSVANAWKSDATLYYLRVTHPATDGTINLASDWCEYWYVSPACLVAGQGRCGLDILVNGKVPPSRVSVSVTNLAAQSALGAVECTLRDAIAAVKKHDRAFAIDQADLSVKDSKPTWRFTHNGSTVDDLFTGKVTHDPGKVTTVNAATCAVTSK